MHICWEVQKIPWGGRLFVFWRAQEIVSLIVDDCSSVSDLCTLVEGKTN